MTPPPPENGRAPASRIADALDLHRAGDAAGARALLARMHAEAPADPAPLRALARIDAGAGDTSRALAHLRDAVALAPDSAATQLEYGCLLGFAGEFTAALEPLGAAARLQPSRADAWHFLGLTLVRLDRHAEALPVLRRARRLDPAHPGTLEALAAAEFRAGFPADALPLWLELARRHPDDETTVLRLGETYSRLGDDEAAIACFRTALARDPASPGLAMALAQAEEDAGHRDAAEQAYRDALARRPGWAPPLAGLLGLARGDAPDDLLQAASDALAGPLDDPARATLGYALGKVHDARREFREAMAAWDDANAARRRVIGDYDDAEIRRRGEAIVQGHPHEDFARRAAGSVADDRPLFIVGMPRSGTTLTEQILAAHPDVFGCGELAELSLFASGLPAAPGVARSWPPRAADIGDDALRRGATRWLQAATRRAPAGVRRLVDKSPLNFQLLGLAARMFPDARVVWCRRDPRDVAVSIYGENFSLDERFATRMEGIAGFVNLMNRLMRHWQEVLPLPILTLDYEALVEDPEGQARRLVDFAGLPWDAACLQFHRRERGVQTPSRWQVRQPVHARSVARWRDYAFALEPLLAALDEAPTGT